MNKCFICEKEEALREFEDPIKHWGCKNCETVFVLDRNGTMSCLDPSIRYKRDKFLDFLFGDD